MTTAATEITSRQDVYCTVCPWRRPSHVNRGPHDHDAFMAYARDAVPRIDDHVGGMGHEVHVRQRTFWDDCTEVTLWRWLTSRDCRYSDDVTAAVPPERREP